MAQGGTNTEVQKVCTLCDQKLQELHEVLQALNSVPTHWKFVSDTDTIVDVTSGREIGFGFFSAKDTKLAVAAFNALPGLVSEVMRLRKRVRVLEAA